MEQKSSLATLVPYAYGTGRDAIYKRISKINTFRNPVTILCPNRMTIQALEEIWLEKSQGLMGLHLVTFDDFVRELTGIYEPVPMPILNYILHEQVQQLQSEGRLSVIDESASFLSLSETLVDLFRELHGQGISLEEREGETYCDLRTIYLQYERFLRTHGLYDLGMVYREAIEVLKSGDWKLRPMMIYGFDSFRTYEWELVDQLIASGCPLEIFQPVSKLNSKTLSTQTFEKFNARPLEIQSLNLEPEDPSGRFIYGFQPLDLYRNLLLDSLEGGELAKTAIYTTSEKVRSEIAMVAETLKIPVGSPIQALDLSRSLLARDFKDFFLCLDLGKPGLINFLRSHYFKQFDDANCLINILKSFEFDDVYDLYQQINQVQKIQLEAREHQLLLDHLQFFMELMKQRENQSFITLIEESEGILQQIAREDLLAEDEALYLTMFEVLEELKLYTPYLQFLSREGFIKLFYEFLNRRRDGIFQREGIDLLTLEQGIERQYDRIYLVDSSIRWPKKSATSFIHSPALMAELTTQGFEFIDEDFNYLKGKAQMESLLAAGDELIFSWIGSEEEYSLVLEDFFDMDHVDKVKVSSYPMTEVTKSSLKMQAHRRQMLESRKDKNSPYHGALCETVGEALGQELNSKPLSATLLDRFVRCPFSNYMEKFLLPDLKMETPESMIPLETGNIYHRVLEETRGEVTDAEEISKILNRHYQESLLSQGKSEAERDIELAYLMTRLMDFIEEDQSRTHDPKKDLGFKTYAVEEKFQGEIGGLTWRGSIDRIDRNEAGDEILIDYKKGSVPAIKDVKEGRVWQLVIYAHIRRNQGYSVQGLTYGSIEQKKFVSCLRNVDRIHQYGRKNKETDLSGEDYEAFFESSLQTLDELIQALYEMKFYPNPINSNQCNACLYQKVCRREEAPWLS